MLAAGVYPIDYLSLIKKEEIGIRNFPGCSSAW